MTLLRRRLSALSAAAFLALAFFCAAAPVLAVDGLDGGPADSSDIQIEEAIPQSGLEKGVAGAASGTVKGASEYIARIYNFAIAICGLVAAAMMIIGGFEYLTSAGDADKIKQAKKRITDAVIGLVLTLGSWALLNSLNPDLVNLKPLTFEGVKTHLNLLAWCEDLTAKGIAVTPVSADPACGAIGKYHTGNSDTPCLYYGQCGAVKSSVTGAVSVGGGWFSPLPQFSVPQPYNLFHTCMQVVNRTNSNGNIIPIPHEEMLAMAAEKPKLLFGICTSCAEITKDFIHLYGYDSLSQACSVWDRGLNNILKEKKKAGDPGQFWSSCVASQDEDSCEQADINCQDADNNSDESDNSQCGNSENDCGCEGYDDHPATYLSTGGTLKNNADTLDDNGAHLSVVCSQNPCKDYVNSKNQKSNFASGCSMPEGSDCRNVGRKTKIELGCESGKIPAAFCPKK